MKSSLAGKRLRRLRQEKGLKIEQVAEVMGVKPNTLGAWERGENKLDSDNMRHLAAVARAAELLEADVKDIWDPREANEKVLAFSKQIVDSEHLHFLLDQLGDPTSDQVQRDVARAMINGYLTAMLLMIHDLEQKLT